MVLVVNDVVSAQYLIVKINRGKFVTNHPVPSSASIEQRVIGL